MTDNYILLVEKVDPIEKKLNCIYPAIIISLCILYIIMVILVIKYIYK